MTTAQISLIVEINGPLATAGSIFNFFNKIGITVPITVEIVKATNKDNDTMIETINASLKTNSVSPARIGFLLMYKKAKTPTNDNAPKIKPFKKPILNSLKMICLIFFESIYSSDNTRIVTAND